MPNMKFLNSRTPAVIAIYYVLFAGAWIYLTSYLVRLGIDDPGFLRQFELVKGLIFVVITGFGLYILIFIKDKQIKENSTPHIQVPSDLGNAPNDLRWLLILFITLLLLVPMLGIGIFIVEKPKVEQRAFDDLQTIAELKARQIEHWLDERYSDARSLTRDPSFLRNVRVIADGDRADITDLQDRLDTFRKSYSYSTVGLLNTNGERLLSSGVEGVAFDPAGMKTYLFQLDPYKPPVPVFIDAEDKMQLELIIPMYFPVETGQLIGALVLHIDPDRFLFPYIQSWPPSEKTGETLLVKQDDKSVQFINHPKYTSRGSINLMFSLDNPDLPAAVALRNSIAGTFNGRDYRNIPVFSAYHPVPGTGWQLIAKMDKKEILNPIYKLILWISLIVLFAFTVIGISLAIVWHQQQRLNALQIATERSRADNLLKLFYDMPFIGVAVTSPMSKLWLHFNDHLCEILGYPPDELARKSWAELTHPDDLDADLVQFEKVMRNESDGYHMDKRFIRKDGRVIHVYIQVRCIRKPNGDIDYFIAMLQDINERKLAEQAVIASNSRLRTLIQTIPDLVWVKDAEGAYIICNSMFERFIGASEADIIGKLDTDFLDEALAAYTHELDRQVMASKGSMRKELDLTFASDGYQGRFEITKAPMFDHQGKMIGLLGVGHDITERKHNELALDKARQQAQSYLDIAGVMIIALDTQGRISMINRKARQLLGYTEEELIGKNWFEQCLPDTNREQIKAVFAKLLTGDIKSLDYMENPVITRSGTERLLAWHNSVLRDEQGRVHALLSSGTDITESRATQVELEAYTHRLRTLIETIPDLVWVKDAEGIYLSCNPMFERFFGASESEIIGKTDFDFVSREQAELFLEHDHKAMQAEKPSINEEWLTFKSSGYRGLFETVKTPMYTDQGTLIGILGIARDITEREQSVAQISHLSRLYATLSQANQAIVRSNTEDELFQQICRNAVEYGGFKLAWIGLIDPATQAIQPVSSYGQEQGYLQGLILSTDPGDDSGAGPAGTALRTGEACWSQDFLNENTAWPWHEQARQAGLASGAALPLYRNGKITGGFMLYAGEPNAFDMASRELLSEMATDISFALDNFDRDRKRLKAEQRLDLIIKGSNDAPWDWDLLNDHLYYSPQWWQLLGYQPDELEIDSSSLWRYLGHPEDIAQVEQTLQRIQLPGHDREAVECRFRHKDGHYVPTLIRGIASRDEAGNTTRLTGTVMDMTERKKAENQLREQLEELNRWFRSTIDREERILELKREINMLLQQRQQPPRYPSANDEDPNNSKENTQ